MNRESGVNMEKNRLEYLRNNELLLHKTFSRISLTMHYDIFRFLNSPELLDIRNLNLGGYQLISNNNHRSKILNYFTKIIPQINETMSGLVDTEKENRKINLLFTQTGNNLIDLSRKIIKENGRRNLMKLLQFNPQITGLKLSKYIL